MITEKFNQTIIKELVEHLDPDGEDKTLIFAATDDHADMVVSILKEEFEDRSARWTMMPLSKLPAPLTSPWHMIRKYKNEKYPNIAVTVDLLTTGVDVPEICNLVFSAGSARESSTSRCWAGPPAAVTGSRKRYFNIFDAVGLYEALEPVTNMKPVAPGPQVTFQMLVDELFDMDSRPPSETAPRTVDGQAAKKRPWHEQGRN